MHGMAQTIRAMHDQVGMATPCIAEAMHLHVWLSLSCSLSADFGVEKAVSIQGDNAAAISTKLEQLVKHGEGLPK